MAETLQEELKGRKREIDDHLRRIRKQLQELEAKSAGIEIGEVTPTAPPRPEIVHLQQVQQSISRQLEAVDREIAADQGRIRRLRYWLAIETIGGVSTVGIVLIVWVSLPETFVYGLLTLAALALLPLMLWTLFRAKRFGWLTVFGVGVVLPTLLLFIPAKRGDLSFLLRVSPLLLFYIYCWSLRHASDDWAEY